MRGASMSCGGCSPPVGHPVEYLVRTDVGPIRLGDLKVGKTRRLTREEVGKLYTAAGL
jgi:23S rRNA pseudouridine2605 synthase